MKTISQYQADMARAKRRDALWAILRVAAILAAAAGATLLACSVVNRAIAKAAYDTTHIAEETPW